MTRPLILSMAYGGLPVVPARSGAEVALGIYYIRPFSSIELACAVRQPGPCVRALCEAVALLLSKNMTCCAGPRCNATSSEHFLNTSHCTLHTPHSTLELHTCTSSQLISSELFSSHFMSSHMSAKFFLTIFISSEHSSPFLISPKLVSTHLGSAARQSTTSYYKACAGYFPVLLCTTKFAQSTSQYYFVLQSLCKARPSTTLYYEACTKKAFTHSKFFRREAFTHRKLF